MHRGRSGVMRRIGLTGGIATGKSHVRARFEAAGVPTADADLLARAVVVPGSVGLQRIVAAFGVTVLAADGALDRRAMGSLVFSDPARRRLLEEIVHPLVQQALEHWFLTLPPGEPLALADVPLLYESGRHGDYDRIIVTACAQETQLGRVMVRDGLSRIEARRRIDAQMPLAEKVRRADYVIWTDGTVAETDHQVTEVHAALDALGPGSSD